LPSTYAISTSLTTYAVRRKPTDATGRIGLVLRVLARVGIKQLWGEIPASNRANFRAGANQNSLRRLTPGSAHCLQHSGITPQSGAGPRRQQSQVPPIAAGN